ncbi:MAG TPA: 4-aminobutyrate--2-oxoglutarate transaminase [Steroidobacteraceae bacterium]|jgi:4-aminobutyrate aminotransferase/(S)-3-amino-2-methylpropionate transaminase|nr:4-aminobutyrate--2-oxoglutarate transaminase [Steroidobacteraceae bacterium]
MGSNTDLHRRRGAAVARGVSNALSVYAQKARNAELWDVEGRRYIDFASGIAVLNTGHVHPRVVAALQQQLTQFTHTCFQVTPYESYVAVCERLNALAPGPTPKKSILFSTGAEAIENALKIARYHTRRSAVIAFHGAFHGRTLATMSLTGKVAPYKAGFGALLPEVFHVPFPCAYHGVTPQQSLAAIEQLFKSELEPSRVAAIIIEPVQGEGGFYIAPPEFLRNLRALCDTHGIVLVADEIQSGFARTGRMFAFEHSGVEPDLMTVAKSIAGGVPLSGVVGKAQIMDAPPPGGLGGTYAGSPLACAAALAVLDVIAEEQLIERARVLGGQLITRLKALQAKFPAIGEVRGLGSMVAIELVKNRRADQPDAELTRTLVQAAAARGLVILSCGVYANVIRILAPLTISDALLNEGLDLLEAAFADVSGAAMAATG